MWGRVRHAGAVGLMTVPEAVAGYVFLMAILAADSIYTIPVVTAGAALAAGLAAEGLLAAWLFGSLETEPATSVSVGILEVFPWLQWGIIVTAGMWSATGIGPATVIFAALLTTLHAFESQARHGTWAPLRNLMTGGVEALAVTTAWVMLLEGATAAAPVAVLMGGFLAEHGFRYAHPDGLLG